MSVANRADFIVQASGRRQIAGKRAVPFSCLRLPLRARHYPRADRIAHAVARLIARNSCRDPARSRGMNHQRVSAVNGSCTRARAREEAPFLLARRSFFARRAGRFRSEQETLLNGPHARRPRAARLGASHLSWVAPFSIQPRRHSNASRRPATPPRAQWDLYPPKPGSAGKGPRAPEGCAA